MAKEKVKKARRCRACQLVLADKNKPIGVCDNCAETEVRKIKRRMVISSIVGIVFIILVFSAIHYARENAYIDVKNGAAYVPVSNMLKLAFNLPFFEGVTNLSLPKIFVTALICFFMPFGSFVKIDFFSPRHEAEKNIQIFDAQAAKSMSTQSYGKLDDVGMFLFSFFLLFISGPFFFIYRIYKIWQISGHIKALDVGQE